MKKVILFSITAMLLLSALTGCSGKENVSDNKDGKITEQNGLIEEASDKLSEIMTTEQSSTQESTQPTTDAAVGGESESTEPMSEDANNSRSRGTMPR